MPTQVKEKPPRSEEIDALRRQVVELQRICGVGVIAGGVIHELNNALTPILNYAKLGLRNDDPEFHRRAFEKILDASERAARLTGGVLGLARPRGQDRVATDLVRLVEEVLLLTGKDLQKHAIKLDFRADARPHALVDAARIQQVLLNLIINARQAMSLGGVLTVRVGTDAAGKTAEISVADTGSGIEPKHLRRIFEPFFTTKSGPDDTGLGGTGLGLPICRDIVAEHKGRIRVESRPGAGSTFTIKLPACASTTPTQVVA